MNGMGEHDDAPVTRREMIASVTVCVLAAIFGFATGEINFLL